MSITKKLILMGASVSFALLSLSSMAAPELSKANIIKPQGETAIADPIHITYTEAADHDFTFEFHLKVGKSRYSAGKFTCIATQDVSDYAHSSPTKVGSSHIIMIDGGWLANDIGLNYDCAAEVYTDVEAHKETCVEYMLLKNDTTYTSTAVSVNLNNQVAVAG
jgi:hypothetical protein